MANCISILLILLSVCIAGDSRNIGDNIVNNEKNTSGSFEKTNRVNLLTGYNMPTEGGIVTGSEPISCRCIEGQLAKGAECACLFPRCLSDVDCRTNASRGVCLEGSTAYAACYSSSAPECNLGPVGRQCFCGEILVSGGYCCPGSKFRLEPSCNSDSDCSDGNDCTLDACINPGDVCESYCSSELIDGCESPLNNPIKFDVSSDQEYNQLDPQMVIDNDKNFIIVWEGEGSSGFDVYGQKYSSLGDKIGNKFRVNTHTTNNQGSPAIAKDPNGEFVVVWQSDGQDGSGFGIYGQRFYGDNSRRGDEFQVNTNNFLDQAHPSVGMDSNGNFISVWLGDVGNGSCNIYGQGYDFDGNRIGDEFEIFANSIECPYDFYFGMPLGRPVISMNPSGQFIVIYKKHARLFNSNKSGIKEFETTFDLSSAAIDKSGNSIIVWREGNNDISGQAYDLLGNEIGNKFRINKITDIGYSPYIFLDNESDFIVVWEGGRASWVGMAGLYANRFKFNSSIGNEFLVINYSIFDKGTNFVGYPYVGLNSLDNFVITWTSRENKLFKILGKIYGASIPQSCLDNTPDNQCSSTKPLYCDNGDLINNCNVCGCDPSHFCNADGSCSECVIPEDNMDVTQSTIFCPGDYYLSNGISIGADNIAVNCNGAALIGTGSRSGISIKNRKGLTVKSCIVKYYVNGIEMDNSNYSVLTGNRLENNDQGIFSKDSNKNNIFYNNVSGSKYHGLYLVYSDENTIQDNDVYHNEAGIGLSANSHSNSIIHNNFCPANENIDFQLLTNNQGSNVGSSNKCDWPGMWNDAGREGCAERCTIQEEPSLTILILPFDWEGTFEEYKQEAYRVSHYFLERIPLHMCPEQFKFVIPEWKNYGLFWIDNQCDKYTSSYPLQPHCFDGLSTLGILKGCGDDYKSATGNNYDYIVGITDQDVAQGSLIVLCNYNVGGWASSINPSIIAQTDSVGIVTHEMGHKFDLADQYCDCWPLCGPGPGSPNPFDIRLGCDKSGSCCWSADLTPFCKRGCNGNFDIYGEDTDLDGFLDTGQRTTMSNLILSGEAGHYDSNEYAYFGLKPQLQCRTTQQKTFQTKVLERTSAENVSVIEISLVLYNNGSVSLENEGVTFGEPLTNDSQEGTYSFKISDNNNDTVYERNFEIYFVILSDPPEVTNSTWFYDRVGYKDSMKSVQLYHNNSLIFSKEINFCNNNSICEPGFWENFYGCPGDCISYAHDNICNNAEDNGCDPDCLSGIDPDCTDLYFSFVNLTQGSIREGETAIIEVVIENSGHNNLSNIFVEFDVDDDLYDIRNASITNNSRLNLEFDYNGTIGEHELSWIIDPGDLISERNETNNIENFNITLNKVFDIPLNTGWNLISTPLSLVNGTLPAPLSSIEGNYNVVFAYDANDVGNEWKSYNPARPAFLNNLTALSPNLGYWIDMTSDDVLELQGIVTSNTTFNLKQGWNLIGYPTLTETNAEELFAPLGDGLGTIFQYKAIDDGDEWKSYSPDRPSFLNTLNVVQPGYGYWVKVDEDTIPIIP